MMVLQKILRAAEKLENPKHPLLGPNLKGLYYFGLWQCGTKLRKIIYNIIHVLSGILIFTEFVDLYQSRKDYAKALLNLSLSVFGIVGISKIVFFLLMYSKWVEIVHAISMEERSQIKKGHPDTIKIMTEYKNYSRAVTYMYWVLVLITSVITITSPFLKYLSDPDYREEIRNGMESYPFMLHTWFPFNKEKMPAYLVVTIIHFLVICQVAGMIATYDSNAVTIMAFLKGQLKILRNKCRLIFGEDKAISEREVLKRVKECHRHHNLIKKVHATLNSVLSPVMFIYVVLCSITICCCVMQLNGNNVPISHKLWAIEFVLAETSQLFMYCWHSNEITVQVNLASQDIFASRYWRSNLKERKLISLLAGKLTHPLILQAGPFTDLSVATFIELMKGSYSFYTLFTQMQDPGS